VGPEVDHSLISSAEIENEWSYNPTNYSITSWRGYEQMYRFVLFSVDHNTEKQLLGLTGRNGLQKLSISGVMPEREVLYAWCASE
jgi:hypothetical protein